MRRVACYSASSFLREAETPEDAGEGLVTLIGAWLKSKGLKRLELGQSTLDGGSGSSVHFDKLSFNEHHLWEVSLDEPSDNGRFFTRISIGIGAKRVFLFLELRAGGDGLLVAPIDVDVRCPRILRELLESRIWIIGNTPAMTAPLKWFGGEAAERFRELIHHRDRNLPIVAVSHYDGQPLSPSLPVDLARDLSGLAVIVEVNEAASWAITDELGKEWSCYNGAVRLYWPYRGRQTSAFAHPLWLRQRLIDRIGSANRAAQQIRDQLRRQLLELSTYTFDESQDFLQLRADAQRHRFDQLRKEAERSGDHEKFAEQIYEQYSIADARRTELETENAGLRAQVQGLLDEFSQTGKARPEDVPPEPDAPVTSVEEAVHRAREAFTEQLIFGDDVEAGVAALSEQAGPPDKIFMYLKTLAELTVARQQGLGRDPLTWLKEHGVKASGESETVLCSASDMRRRTWHDGDVRREFQMHLKPVDGSSPDRCVRIYFDYVEEKRKTIVAYVGRHP
jgi:hypothetical protein